LNPNVENRSLFQNCGPEELKTIGTVQSNNKIKVNVKQSRYRPGVAERVPGS